MMNLCKNRTHNNGELTLSDVGKIISPADFDKTDADDYLMNEDDEKIYFLIKTKVIC